MTDQYVPYIRPQENGGHADVRWLELDGPPGALRIELDEPRQVSVTHLRAADLAAATHDIDVVPVAETIVHLDAAHRGLGTASCGPDTLPRVPAPRRHLPLGLDPARPPSGLIDARHLVAGDPRVPPHEWPDQLRHPRPWRRVARSRPFRSRARPPVLDHQPRSEPVRRVHEPGRRPDRPRIPDDRHRRLPRPGADGRAGGRLDRPRPRLSRPSDRARQACPATWRRAAGDLRRIRRRSRHARPAARRRRQRARGRAQLHDLPRRPGRRPERAHPQRRGRPGSPDRRDERGARPPRRALGPAPAERRLGAREPRRDPAAAPRPPVGRQ